MKSLYFMVVAALGLTCCAEPFLESPPLETLTPAQRAAQINYPPEAKAGGVPGLAELSCEVTPAHRLTDCEVRYESLPGWGFGVAALRTADSVQVQSSVPSGVRVSQFIIFCNTASGCDQMDRLRAEIRRTIARNRAEAGLPPMIMAPVGHASGAEVSE